MFENISILTIFLLWTLAASINTHISRDTSLQILNEKDDDIIDKDTTSLHLLYGYDERLKQFEYCEWATMDQINDQDARYFEKPVCKNRNADLVMYIKNEPYFAYFAFSRGRIGVLAECPVPRNVTLSNCTYEHYVYSVCKYSCEGDLVPRNRSTICKLTGPYHNVTPEWSHFDCGSESKPRVGGGIERSGKDKWTATQIVPIVIAAAVGVIIVICIICCASKRLSHPRMIHLQGPEANKMNDAQGHEGGQKPPPVGLEELGVVVQQARNQPGGAFPPEPPIDRAINIRRSDPTLPESGIGAVGGVNPEYGLSERQFFRHGGDFATGDHSSIQDPEAEKKALLQGALKESLDCKSLGSNTGDFATGDHSSIQDDDPVAEKEALLQKLGTSDLDECTMSVNLLLRQSTEFLDEFCELVEAIDNDTKSTLMELASTMHKELGFISERGVKLHQNDRNYRDDLKPCLGLLTRMAEHGIIIGVLVSYFRYKDQVDLILQVHTDCSYCKRHACGKETRKGR